MRAPGEMSTAVHSIHHSVAPAHGCTSGIVVGSGTNRLSPRAVCQRFDGHARPIVRDALNLIKPSERVLNVATVGQRLFAILGEGTGAVGQGLANLYVEHVELAVARVWIPRGFGDTSSLLRL
jgi:hypothetical protein